MMSSKLLIVLSFFTFLIFSCKSLIPQNESIEVFSEDMIDWSHYKGKPTMYFNLLHTQLDLTIDPEEKSIFGTAEMTLKTYAYLQEVLRLDILGLKIKNVEATLNGASVIDKIETDEASLYVYFLQPIETSDTIFVTITYQTIPYESICPDEQIMFLGKADSAGKPMSMWTNRGSNSKLTWYPTFLAPSDRSTFELHLSHDKNYQTFLNGNRVASTEEENHITDFWIIENPVSVSSMNFYMSNDQSRVLTVCDEFTDQKNELSRFKGLTKLKLKSILSFYDSLFGYDLSDQQVNVFLVEENYQSRGFRSGFFWENASTHDFTSIQKEWYLSSSLASRWFDGLLNHASLADLPLMNSLRAYSGYLWIEHSEGSDIANDLLTRSFKDAWGNIDEENAIVDYYNSVSNAESELLQIKGMYVFHLLRNYVGDQVFFNSIRHLVKTNEFLSVDIIDLQKSFEKISGEDLTWFFQQWFFWPGLPVIDAKYTIESDTLHLNVVQHNLVGKPYRLTTYLDVYFEDKVIQYPIIIENSTHSFRVPIENIPKAVVIDPYFELSVGINRNLNKSTLNYLLLNINDDEQLKAYVLQELIENDYFKDLNNAQIKQIFDFSNDQMISMIFNMLATGKTPLAKNQIMDLLNHFESKTNFRESVAYFQLQKRIGKVADWEKLTNHEDASIRAFAIAQNYSETTLPDAASMSVLLNDSSAIVQLVMADLLGKKGISNYGKWFAEGILSCSSDILPDLLDYFFVYLNNSTELLTRDHFTYIRELSEKSNRPEVRLIAAQLLTTGQNEQMAANTLDELILKECNDQLIEIYQLMKLQLNK